ncbi:MAG: hypothetical protein CFE45_27105 [Burkholderiales bacterium PBB5]|nr:MAG: hypothetical protein CFE45_27105 [Burkholderiales bacterium PBB5]
MTEFPPALKHITAWLVLGTAVFLGVQAWQNQRQQSRFSVQGGVIVQSSTAGGTVQGWTGRGALQLQGGVQVERLPITVLPALGSPLLGMDVLGRLRFSQTDGVLRIQAQAGQP